MMSMEQDHYGVLELEPGSPMEDVKSQYRRLAKLCHPDLHGDDARCAEQFRRVNAAYTFLSDAPRKAAYDAVLQAARRAGAPPLRPMPLKSPPSPASRSHQASVTPAGFQGGPPEEAHEGSADSIRMTRSAWLGATAGAVVVLLVVGLSLDGSSPRRPANFGVSPSIPVGGAAGIPPEERRGDGLTPSGNADPAADSTAADSTAADSTAADSTVADADPAAPPVAVPVAAPAPRLRVPTPFTTPAHPGIVGSAWAVPRAVPAAPAGAVPSGAVSADADPTDTLRRRLLARYRAALPRADRLLARGSAARAEAGDGPRRLLREQLAADLAGLSAARERLRPALARLSERDAPDQVRQEAGPFLTDLDRLEEAGRPVRSDIKALAAATPDPRPPRVAFHFRPLVPLRPEVAPPAPSPVPVPAVASTAPPQPRPPDSPAPEPAAKPKTPADSGHEFIMWGSK